MRRRLRGTSTFWILFALPALAASVASCSGSSASGTATALVPVRPGPLLLQYVGEYDAPNSPRPTQLVFHVDGSFEATMAGHPVTGVFTAAGEHDASWVHAVLAGADGSAAEATFRTAASGDEGPPRLEVLVSGAMGDAELFAPWVAPNEPMCRGSDGFWTGDDPDSATGPFCRCPPMALYLPSRGGCVKAPGTSDPPRVGLSYAMRAALGHYEGNERIADLTLAEDGTYIATVDDAADTGTFWDAGTPGTFALTSVSWAFFATFEAGVLTLDLGDHVETLTRRR